LFLSVLEAGKCKSWQQCLVGAFSPCYPMVEGKRRSVQWQAGLRCNGEKDFMVSIVRPKAAEGLGN
uniref:Uncharacterized protein n=1 Tax=Microcebus murinus TaxID=30608 RepID=A0A8C5XBI2_MICMU